MTRQELSEWVEVQGPAQQQSHQTESLGIREKPLPKQSFTVHTSLLFDPHSKKWLKNAAVEVDTKSGLITSVTEDATKSAIVSDGDINLRGYTVVPGFGKCSAGDDASYHGGCRAGKGISPAR